MHIAALLFATILVVAHPKGAASQELRSFDVQTIFNSVKCELGTYAQSLKSVRTASTPTQARVVVSGTETLNKKIGASINFIIINIGGSYSSEVTDRWRSTRNRNIHPENSINCRKVSRVDVGILSCLRRQTSELVEGAETECTRTVKATGQVSGGARLPTIWIVDAEPSGELSKTRAFEVTVTAPPPAK